MVKVSTLKTNPGNPRQIKGDKLNLLKASVSGFQKMMDLRPIIVDEENVVLGGNMRLAAIRSLGMKEVPDSWVKRAEGLTEDEKREFVIKDNAGFGEWDWDMLARDWNDLPLAEWGLDIPDTDGSQDTMADATPQIDRAAELNETWMVQPGDVWQVGIHRLVCGDSTNAEHVRSLLGTDRASMMVTDPPYGVKYDPAWRENAASTGKVHNDDRADWADAYRLTNAAVAYVWHAAIYAGVVSYGLEVAGFDIRSQIIWTKKRVPMSRGHYHWAHEPCWYAVRKGATGSWSGGRKQRTVFGDVIDTFSADDESQYALKLDAENIYLFPASASTVWELPHDAACGGGHSTQKPQECMARPIRNHGQRGDIIHDPFLGSGTTMVACENLGRICRGMEFSENYCAVILERMATAFPDIEIKRLDG